MKGIKEIGKGIKVALEKNAPAILTGFGVAGTVTGVGFAIWGTVKAVKAVEQKKDEKHVERLTPVDTAKTVWKYYIPTAVTTGLSVTCAVAACKESAKRNAALAAAYSLSEVALKEYRNKVVETIGEKKEQSIRDAVAKDRVEQNPPVSSQILVTGSGKMRCLDSLTGRYFESDIETIRRAENELNKRMMCENYVSLNDFYDEINLPQVTVGDGLGWNVNKEGFIELRFSSQLAPDNVPVLVIDYSVSPRWNYSELYD